MHLLAPVLAFLAELALEAVAEILFELLRWRTRPEPESRRRLNEQIDALVLERKRTGCREHRIDVSRFPARGSPQPGDVRVDPGPSLQQAMKRAPIYGAAVGCPELDLRPLAGQT